MALKKIIVNHALRDKGLIPDLFPEGKMFFKNRLRIMPMSLLQPQLKDIPAIWHVAIGTASSSFIMPYGLHWGWYNAVIMPIETISGFFELVELAHPSIDYANIATYVYNLIYYLSDNDYPSIQGSKYGYDPNAISYYIGLGDQIESYLQTMKKANIPFTYGQQVVNHVYLSNIIRLVNETTAQRAIVSIIEDGEIITFCEADQYNGNKMIEVVYTNKKDEFVRAYAFTNDLLINVFIYPIINLIKDRQGSLNEISYDEFKQYFDTLHSLHSCDDDILTQSFILNRLIKLMDNKYTSIIKFINDNIH